ncbi:MAG: hypothetical protein J7527_01675 [Chitinophagaceae bacterium]|nr:hypothetical protein [Chitinophagaceae bacterium]
MKDVPQKIYLQVGDDYDPSLPEKFGDLREVTWCSNRVHDSDIEYVKSGYEAAEGSFAEWCDRNGFYFISGVERWVDPEGNYRERSELLAIWKETQY